MKLKWLFVLLIPGLLAWYWLTQGGDELDRLSANSTILAFGDSLTQGVGAPKGHDYPSVLAELTGMRVINRGISGETTGEGLRRFAAVLDEVQPELVLLLEGGNDFLRNQSEQQVEQNLARMIELAQARGIALVLIAVPQKSVWLSPARLYSRLAERYRVLLIESLLTELLSSPELKSDSVHLNELGYRKLAEQIQQSLVQAGAL